MSKSHLGKVMYPVVGVVLVLAFWQLACIAWKMPTSVLPHTRRRGTGHRQALANVAAGRLGHDEGNDVRIRTCLGAWYSAGDGRIALAPHQPDVLPIASSTAVRSQGSAGSDPTCVVRHGY